MLTVRPISTIVLAAFLVLLSGCASDQAPAVSREASPLEIPLAGYLPPRADPGSWKPSGPPLFFEGEELFEYINGGAELYYEYRFKRVLVQEYRNPEEEGISLELYEMADPAGAFGIYSFKRGPEGRALTLGRGGLLESYYLNFWKGSFLVTLTGFDGGRATLEGLEAIACAVDARIPLGGDAPGLVSALPGEGLGANSVKYMLGRLGWFNHNAFFPENLFAFDEAVKGDYKKGYQVFLFGYGNASDCLDKFVMVKARFRESAEHSRFTEENGSFRVDNEAGRLLFLEPFERHIILVAGAGTPADAKAVSARAKKNLDSLPK